MRQGGMLLVTAAVLACTACLGETGKLEVRPTTTGLKVGREPVPFRIAEARAHLALGNVALALEGFRKAWREDPASAEALAGIASCYDQMQRFDLSRRHYEMALALAPRENGLLGAFAASLDRQGLAAEAASVRREMAALVQAPAPAPTLAEMAPAVAMSGLAPVPAAPQTAAAVGQSVTIALPPPRPAAIPVLPAKPRAMSPAPVGPSVTIALRPPRPATTAGYRQPRIERLSLNEVALVTSGGPRWKKMAAQPLRTATAIAPSKVLEVRLLNAARIDKLAARTRSYLGRYGWRDMAVGDAAAVRARSLIIYPRGTRQAASRLSARLGFAMAERPDVRQLTILLGRDAVVHPGLRPKA
jgi:hypothetical protein